MINQLIEDIQKKEINVTKSKFFNKFHLFQIESAIFFTTLQTGHILFIPIILYMLY